MDNNDHEKQNDFANSEENNSKIQRKSEGKVRGSET